VEQLVKNEFFLLADEMGAGKTKQTIDAAQILFDRGYNQVIVIAPSAARSLVWYDPELGELAKHLWDGHSSEVIEYHVRSRAWGVDKARSRWLITNYEFIRSEERLKNLLRVANRETILILDESSMVKSWRAKQSRACLKLRNKCGRVWLLNGTPISHSPLDMYSQGQIMSKSILDVRGITEFKARYCVMGGYVAKTRFGPIKTQIIKWKNLEDLQARFKPYTLRRLTRDCWDMPPSIDPMALSVQLDKETWKIYKEMAQDLIAWLNKQTVAVSPMAGVKVMRLAQICAGFVGGVKEEEVCYQCRGESRDPQEQVCQLCGGLGVVLVDQEDQELHDSKLQATMSWIRQRFEEDPNKKLLIWSRFRPEVARLYNAIMGETSLLPLNVGRLWGLQKRDERAEAIRLLDPRATPDGPVVVLGTPDTGALGLNLTASHTVLYTSNSEKLAVRLQSIKRVDRPGQVHPVSYTDLVATGPEGQKTIDHAIAKGLRNKEDLATWTCSAWVRALEEE
jgi:hypothetical protein